MKNILRWIDSHFEEIVLSCFMAYFVFATAMQVFARLVMKVAMPWTEETARYVLIWMTMLGCAYAAKKNSHIRIDIIESMLKNGQWLRLIAFLIFLVFILSMTVAGIRLCSGLIDKPQYSSVLRIPMLYVYLALPVGMGMTAYRIIQHLWIDLRSTQKGGDK